MLFYVEKHPLDVFLNTSESTEGFVLCVGLMGTSQWIFASRDSAHCFLPVSSWEMAFLSGLPPCAMISTKNIFVENRG